MLSVTFLKKRRLETGWKLTERWSLQLVFLNRQWFTFSQRDIPRLPIQPCTLQMLGGALIQPQAGTHTIIHFIPFLWFYKFKRFSNNVATGRCYSNSPHTALHKQNEDIVICVQLPTKNIPIFFRQNAEALLFNQSLIQVYLIRTHQFRVQNMDQKTRSPYKSLKSSA